MRKRSKSPVKRKSERKKGTPVSCLSLDCYNTTEANSIYCKSCIRGKKINDDLKRQLLAEKEVSVVVDVSPTAPSSSANRTPSHTLPCVSPDCDIMTSNTSFYCDACITKRDKDIIIPNILTVGVNTEDNALQRVKLKLYQRSPTLKSAPVSPQPRKATEREATLRVIKVIVLLCWIAFFFYNIEKIQRWIMKLLDIDNPIIALWFCLSVMYFIYIYIY